MIRSGNEHIASLFESSWTRTRDRFWCESTLNYKQLETTKTQIFVSIFFFWRNMFSQSPSISVLYAIPKPWIILNLRTGVLEAQDEANHRWQVLICLPWLEGNKIRFYELFVAFKKAHVFGWVYGSWMIKSHFLHWDFSGFGSDSLSQRVAKFAVFLLFSNGPFRTNSTLIGTLQYSDLAMEKRKSRNFWM